MSKNVTNHMLRKQFAETIEASRQYLIKNSGTSGTGTASLVDDKISTTVTVMNIVKVQGNYVITDNGDKAELFNPMPCLFWKCVGSADKNGVITLRNRLKGLFISDDTSIYCLGVSGQSDEFEVRMQVGDNEVRLNNLFLNLSAPHIVKNGLEE